MRTVNNYNKDFSNAAVGTFEIDYSEKPFRQTVTDNNQDLHYLYRQAPSGIIMTIIAALIVSWFVLPVTPDYIFFPWLTFIVLTALIHTFIIKEYSRQKNNLQIDNQWAIYQTFIVGVTGLAFSIGHGSGF